MCLLGSRLKKHIIFHILYIIVAPLCPAFLKRWEARCSLIGQLSSALWLAEYLKLEVFTGPLGSENPRLDPKPERVRVQNFYECLGHGSGSVLAGSGVG